MFKPHEIMQSRRDAVRERELKAWLRTRSDDERFEFISACLEYRGYPEERLALQLATACISRKADAHRILELGMTDPDASSIKFWLDFAIRKLGSRAVIRRIANQIDTNPDVVDKALYWLPSLVPKSESGSRAALKELRRGAKSKNIIRGAQMNPQPDGTILFSDIYPEDRS